MRIKQFAIPHLSKCESRAREKSLQLAKMRSKFLEPSADVSRDNNLYVVGDISRKCLDTTETNNYQAGEGRVDTCVI